MTALNVIVKRDSVHLLTDGAAYDENGVLEHPAAKVWALPHLNAVFAASGYWDYYPLLAKYYTTMGTNFDELSWFAPTITAAIHAEHKKPLQVILAGIQQSGEPAAFFFSSPGEHLPFGMKPWVPVKMENGVSAIPSNDEISKAFFEAFPFKQGMSPDAFDPVRDGLKLLKIQRAQPLQPARDKPAVSLVGCFAQHTVVSADGISMRIIHRWPDQIGEKIGETRQGSLTAAKARAAV